MSALITKLHEILAPTITTMGFELWGIETPSQTGGILRIYIDAEQGITLEDATHVSNQVSAILDVEDILTERYRLEVSSPGLDRPLFTEKQYDRFLGETAKVQLNQSINNQKNYKGVIKEVADNKLVLFNEEENKEVTLPIDCIVKANLISN